MQLLLINFVHLFTESAPWLLLGLLIAGVMNQLVPISLLQKQLGKDNWISIVKAAFIGAPLPLCSCGVIPAAIGLRRAGASKSASISFLVATPETGVDSVSISYALLGPFLAVARPVAAIISAIFTGFLVMILTVGEKQRASTDVKISNNSSCCSKKSEEIVANCCDQEAKPVARVALTEKAHQIALFSTGKLLEDITPWLLVGLILAAAINTWVPVDFLTQWGSGFSAMLIMALVGVPMYICATASTPMAAGFLAAGVSPGAVMVFMLAGPATNISTMGMIRREMGGSTLMVYLIGIVSASICIGYLVNWLIAEFGFSINNLSSASHSMQDSLFYPIAAIFLGLLMARNYLKRVKHYYTSKAQN